MDICADGVLKIKNDKHVIKIHLAIAKNVKIVILGDIDLSS